MPEAGALDDQAIRELTAEATILLLADRATRHTDPLALVFWTKYTRLEDRWKARCAADGPDTGMSVRRVLMPSRWHLDIKRLGKNGTVALARSRLITPFTRPWRARRACQILDVALRWAESVPLT